LGFKFLSFNIMTSVNPATLSAPSPTSTHEDIDPNHEAGPARKRLRTQGITTEERRDARAHRNRVAAQNSRDRRKAQFVYLERRVAELEEENRLLRAGAGIPPAAPAAFPPLSAKLEEERLRDERARERERENEELKERVQTLEGGWDAVIKALGAQGLLNGISSSIAPTPTTTSTTAASLTDTTSSLLIDTNETSSKPDLAAFPSPAPSNDSLESEFVASPTTLTDASSHDPESKEVQSHVPRESARHLARVASIESPSLVSSMALQRVVSLSAPMHSPVPPPYLRALQLKQLANSRSDPRLAQKKMATAMTTLWRPSSMKSSCRHVRPSRRRKHYLCRLRTLRK
jgi:hypothetical protein